MRSTNGFFFFGCDSGVWSKPEAELMITDCKTIFATLKTKTKLRKSSETWRFVRIAEGCELHLTYLFLVKHKVCLT